MVLQILSASPAQGTDLEKKPARGLSLSLLLFHLQLPLPMSKTRAVPSK